MEAARENIIRAAMTGVRRHGMDGVTMRHISELAGVSAGAAYVYFNSKDELMAACFTQVDMDIANLFREASLDPVQLVHDPEEAVRQLWLPYFRWLVAHPDETVFYHRFRDNPAFPQFDKERDISYFAPFLASVQAFDKQYSIFNQIDPNILWLFVLTGTVMYAKYVVEGVLPPGPITENSIFRLIFSGLQGALHMSSE